MSVTNNYASVLTLNVADKTYTIPGGAADYAIDVGAGQYTYTATVPGMAQGMGLLLVNPTWNTVLACGKRS